MAAARPQITDKPVNSDDSWDWHEPGASEDTPARLERDPVCGMMVDERENKYTYRGIGQTFCSQQCRERFAAAPDLYVGRRRLPAPKQRGVEMIKLTRVVLGAALSEAQFGALRGELLSMMGVIAVYPMDGASERGPERYVQAVVVTYDLLQATAAQLERRMVEMNATLSNSWGERLLRDFVHYTELCELVDLELRDVHPDRRKKIDRRGLPGFRTGARARTARGHRKWRGSNRVSDLTRQPLRSFVVPLACSGAAPSAREIDQETRIREAPLRIGPDYLLVLRHEGSYKHFPPSLRRLESCINRGAQDQRLGTCNHRVSFK